MARRKRERGEEGGERRKGGKRERGWEGGREGRAQSVPGFMASREAGRTGMERPLGQLWAELSLLSPAVDQVLSALWTLPGVWCVSVNSR